MSYHSGKPLPTEAPYLDLSESGPILVLACDRQYNFTPRCTWEVAEHRYAGLANKQALLCFTRIPVPQALSLNLLRLTEEFRASNLGAFSKPSLPEVMTYRRQLRRLLKVDCRHSFYDLAEGLYPIDATARNLAQLSYEAYPASLVDLIDWGDNKHILKCVDFKIFILAHTDLC